MKMKIEKRIQVKAVSLGVRVMCVLYMKKGGYKNIFQIIEKWLRFVCACVCVCVLSNCVCLV